MLSRWPLEIPQNHRLLVTNRRRSPISRESEIGTKMQGTGEEVFEKEEVEKMLPADTSVGESARDQRAFNREIRLQMVQMQKGFELELEAQKLQVKKEMSELKQAANAREFQAAANLAAEMAKSSQLRGLLDSMRSSGSASDKSGPHGLPMQGEGESLPPEGSMMQRASEYLVVPAQQKALFTIDEMSKLQKQLQHPQLLSGGTSTADPQSARDEPSFYTGQGNITPEELNRVMAARLVVQEVEEASSVRMAVGKFNATSTPPQMGVLAELSMGSVGGMPSGGGESFPIPPCEAPPIVEPDQQHRSSDGSGRSSQEGRSVLSINCELQRDADKLRGENQNLWELVRNQSEAAKFVCPSCTPPDAGHQD